MRIMAISDLHLGKDMSAFGPEWIDHKQRIKDWWDQVVGADDAVLVPGDICWATKPIDAIPHLRFLDDLAGVKILGKGNHCLWWSNSKSKMHRFFAEIQLKTISPLNAGCIVLDRVAVVATRGWVCPEDRYFEPSSDSRAYTREVSRLAKALEAVPKGAECVICMMHFPPFANGGDKTRFVRLLQDHGVDIVVYGHLHGEHHQEAFVGKHWEMEFRCVSADFVQFVPVEILTF